jgi:uncharacterized repeat protein (TIGR01451 family)
MSIRNDRVSFRWSVIVAMALVAPAAGTRHLAAQDDLPPRPVVTPPTSVIAQSASARIEARIHSRAHLAGVTVDPHGTPATRALDAAEQSTGRIILPAGTHPSPATESMPPVQTPASFVESAQEASAAPAPIVPGDANCQPLVPIPVSGQRGLPPGASSVSECISPPPPPWRDEVVIDGGDRGLRAAVDADWRIRGLEPEDTIAHFDTLAGQRIVQPSNPVCIYTPRFSAVRRITNLVESQHEQIVSRVDDLTQPTTSRWSDWSTTTRQHLQTERTIGATVPTGLKDTTRGVLVDNTLSPIDVDGTLAIDDTRSLASARLFQAADKARLAMAIDAAKSWDSNVSAQSTVENLEVLVAADTRVFETTVHVQNEVNCPCLRLAKLASECAAHSGDELEFSIRFDNIGNQLLGNVTIVDNLSGRLEYIPDSATCSVAHNFLTEINDAGSLVLRWEILDPVAVGSGGLVRFKCRVR